MTFISTALLHLSSKWLKRRFTLCSLWWQDALVVPNGLQNVSSWQLSCIWEQPPVSLLFTAGWDGGMKAFICSNCINISEKRISALGEGAKERMFPKLWVCSQLKLSLVLEVAAVLWVFNTLHLQLTSTPFSS